MTAYEEQMDHCLCGWGCCIDPGVARDISIVAEAYAKGTKQDSDKVKMQIVKGLGKVYETIESRFGEIKVKNLAAESIDVDVKELERILKYKKE